MRKTFVGGIGLALLGSLLGSSLVEAYPQRNRQRQNQRNPRQAGGQQDGQRNLLGEADTNPLAIGEAGVAWYTTWETGLAEAKRSHRPIFFMSAATTCSGVPGVFWPGYTKVQNSLFSTEEFIKASRDFVCIRIETFENEESEALVKNILGGDLANTAFVILSPDGTERLTASGRSPGMAMIQGRSRTDTSGSQNVSIINQMQQIANRFAPQQDGLGVGLQDFHSLRQALNCASADQRPLVVVNTGGADRSAVENKLKSLFEDEQIIGKFHLDFIDRRVDRGWESTLDVKTQAPAILIIRPGQFGLEGQILKQVALDANTALIKRSLLEANREYANVESRKDYEQHVRAGKRRRVEFENEISREGAIDYRPNRKQRGR